MNKVYSLLFVLIFFLGCDATNNSSSALASSVDSASDVTQTTTAKSSIPMLVILVSYSNVQISSSLSTWSQKLFGKDEGELNHYYYQASAGNFEFSPVENIENISDGVVNISFNKNHPDIDIDYTYVFNNSVHPDLASSLKIIDRETDIDFSNYDTDANGFITPDELLLTFIIAGYEDSYAGKHITNGVWAHQSCISDSSYIPILDGVKLMSCSGGGNYALFGELHYEPGMNDKHDATIGIIAHELGHSAFNLPDLYNTSDPDSGGIGYFGLMGSGTWAAKNSYEYPGATPTHFSAWSKIYNKWITPREESYSSTTLNATSSIDYDIIKIPINSTSYYLLENRNNSGYDQGLYSIDGNFQGGMAIWKIDETKLSQSYFYNNSVNADTNNKGVDLVEAQNGLIDAYGDWGHENALYYSGNKDYFLNLVSDISEPSSVMNLNIN